MLMINIYLLCIIIRDQRFLPSEFGMDPSRMGDALEPGRVSFDEKMVIRRAIEDANIPHTYVSANCFAAYFCPNLCQMKTLLPPKERVGVYGDGNVKGKLTLAKLLFHCINFQVLFCIFLPGTVKICTLFLLKSSDLSLKPNIELINCLRLCVTKTVVLMKL
jgi:hypothetical protein